MKNKEKNQAHDRRKIDVHVESNAHNFSVQIRVKIFQIKIVLNF